MERAESKAKLNSIFDYEDSEDELQKKVMDRMTGAESIAKTAPPKKPPQK